MKDVLDRLKPKSMSRLQMYDPELGLLAADQVLQTGVTVRQGVEVIGLDKQANLFHQRGCGEFDRNINLAGPWATSLLDPGDIPESTRQELTISASKAKSSWGRPSAASKPMTLFVARKRDPLSAGCVQSSVHRSVAAKGRHRQLYRRPPADPVGRGSHADESGLLPNVFGGKWTTLRALGEKLTNILRKG